MTLLYISAFLLIVINKFIPFLFLILSNQLYANTPDTTLANNYLAKATTLIDALQYQEALQLTDSAISIYQAIIDSLPQLGLAINLKGDALFEIGNYQEALNCYINAKNILVSHYGNANAVVAQTYNNIGRCYMAAEAIYAAAENYQKALEIRVAIFGTNHAKVADSFNNLGNCAVYLGALPEAYQYYGQSLDIRIKLFGRQHIDVASSLNNLGYCQMEVKDYAKAIGFFQESLTIREDTLGRFHPKVIQNCQNLGDAYIQLDKIDTAFIYFNRALEIFKYNRQENHPDVAKVYNGFGNGYVKLSNYKQALNYFEKALALQLEKFPSDSYRLFPVYNELADTYAALGDYNKALIYYQNNLKILHDNVSNDHPHVALTHNNIGKTFQKTSKFQEALKHYNQAVNIFTTLGDNHFLATTFNNIGNCFWEGEKPKIAIPIYQRSLKIFEDLYGAAYIELAPIHYNLGNCLEKEKAFQYAHFHYEKAIAVTKKVYGDNHPSLAKYKTSKGTAYQEQGKYQLALEQFDEAFSILNINLNQQEAIGFIESPIPFIDLLNAKANTLYALYSSTKKQAYLMESLSYYEHAIQTIQSLRKQYQEETSRYILGEKAHINFAEAIRTCYALFQLTSEQQYMEMAFTYSEQSRSRVLLDAINTNSAIQFGGIPDSLIQKESRLKTNIAFFEKKVQAENRKKNQVNLGLLDNWSNKIFTLKQTYHELIKQFEKNYPTYFQLKYANQTITLAEIQKNLLAENAALVEYFVADSTVYTFVVNHHTTHFEAIDFKDISHQIQNFRTGIYLPHTTTSNNDSTYLAYLQQYVKAAHVLYQKLWQPMAKKLPQKVIVINGGMLNLLPFEALLTSYPKRLDRQKGFPYLLKKHELSYGYSATLLHQIAQEKAANYSKRLLAFAPIFTSADTKGFLPLDYNIPEVQAIQQLTDGNIHLGQTATRQQFLETADAYQIIHLATHGKADANVGDYSFLAFTATADTTLESLLYAKDIYNLSLNADMVILSACETGDGEFFKGEGVVSLGSAFFYAGAKSIVSSLWSVNDASTQKLMGFFYQGIQSGATKSTALRQAKLQYLEQANFPHPFYWAAFVGNGDMKAIPPASRFWRYFKWMVGLGMLVFGISIWRRK